MTKTILSIITVLALCSASLAQDADYYKAIQKRSSTRVQPAQFKQMEEKALKDYSQAGSYEVLATSFGNTTEKVWAVIYGEVYCNLSPDPEQVSRVGSLVYQWYGGSLSRQGNGLSVSLTENAQSSQKQLPFESLFEQSFLMGAAVVKGDFPPLSIQTLTAIRKNQLSLWNQKKLPETELVRRQEAILSAGHFEAYNYWLFKGARADEFSEWIKSHQDQFQAWLDWQSKNKFTVETPDFQRLYLLRKPSRSSAAPASLIHEAGHAEGMTETVDPKTGNLHLTIPAGGRPLTRRDDFDFVFSCRGAASLVIFKGAGFDSSSLRPVSPSNRSILQTTIQPLNPTIKNQLEDTSGDYVYDAAGNLTQPGPIGGPYVYDAENHLISADGVTYTYDGDGNRVMKSNGTIYWYSANSASLEESDLSGNLQRWYYFFNGQRVARQLTTNEMGFYMTDALGSVRYLGGSATGYRFDYFPFGAPILDSDTGDDRYQFTGKERDAESGLDNFGARFNSSSFGRFMSPDPTFESALRVNPQTWNRYSYTLNNPLNYIDPDGELWQQSLTGTWDWMDKCNAGATCVTQIAQQEGNNVVAYGPSSAKDKKTFAANKQGYINVADIEATDGAYFQFQPGVTATYASPQTAVDLYNGAFDYHQEYPDDSKLSLNDIGKPDGAAFDPHLTHNLGRALDMSYMGEDGKPIHRGKLGVWLADDDRMKALVRIFTENGFNQSYSDNDTGLGVNWAHDHMNHIHFGKNLHTGQCEIGPCQ